MALVIPEEKRENYQYPCRICLELDDKDNLVWPCNCRGSVKYVHEKCLIKWIQSTSNEEYKKKCSICKTPFFIKNNSNRETLKFNLSKGATNIVLELILIEILLAVFSCIISTIDHVTNIYSSRLLTLNLYKTNNLDYTLLNLYNVSIPPQNFGRDMAVLFYYNYAHYNFYLFSYILFFMYIFKNLKHKNLYYKFMKLKILCFFIYYNFFFIFFNLLMWDDSYIGLLFFNIFMLVISYLNFFMFKSIMITHNDTVNYINDKYFKIEILNVEPNPLLLMV